MQVAADDRILYRFFGTDDTRYPTSADIERDVASHLAAVSAFDSGIGICVLIVVGKRGVAANVNIRNA